MSLCDALDGGRIVCGLLLEADQCAAVDEAKSLRLLTEAVQIALFAQPLLERARASLTAAMSGVPQREPYALQPHNDNHPEPSGDGPIVA